MLRYLIHNVMPKMARADICVRCVSLKCWNSLLPASLEQNLECTPWEAVIIVIAELRDFSIWTEHRPGAIPHRLQRDFDEPRVDWNFWEDKDWSMDCCCTVSTVVWSWFCLLADRTKKPVNRTKIVVPRSRIILSEISAGFLRVTTYNATTQLYCTHGVNVPQFLSQPPFYLHLTGDLVLMIGLDLGVPRSILGWHWPRLRACFLDIFWRRNTTRNKVFAKDARVDGRCVVVGKKRRRSGGIWDRKVSDSPDLDGEFS